MKDTLILPFNRIGRADVARVGGKNASLGEMFNALSSKGIRVPDGFATTAEGFRLFLRENNLEQSLKDTLSKLDTHAFANLAAVGQEARQLILEAVMPDDFAEAISTAYEALCEWHGREADVAVRSSATAEDLPTASFAGQHDTFLNRKGAAAVVDAVQRCFASLYNNRAIKYRHDHGFDQLRIALSAGVQLMVRADLACSGVLFTLEPESGFRDAVVVSGTWGLGENIVQGNVNPDEFVVFKPTLRQGKYALLSKKCGAKEKTMVYGAEDSGVVNLETPPDKQRVFVLNDDEVSQLAQWSMDIEAHYGCPMDIEWAKDGNNNQLFIVQARPETVHSQKDPYLLHEYELAEQGAVLAKGSAVGSRIASGTARLLRSPAEADRLQAGDILVTDMTNPDWDPIMKKAAAIVTNKGGRTSHAAIVAREVGAAAIVGAVDATAQIRDGQPITVSCAQGKTGFVYDGRLAWREKQVNFRDVTMPRTAPMLILGDPDKAFKYSFYPNRGIGLMRLEFIINNAIRIHPMALVRYDTLPEDDVKKEIADITRDYPDKTQYFIDKLASAVATIAAAFYNKEVIVRMSDFKTNEYANLIGGRPFEPEEENPMLGFRGASRYYNERYREGFRLECAAMRKVREEMGFTNVKLMIPFCRTVAEGKKVVELMAENGLKRGENGLEIYVMAEIPSNVVLARAFAEVFDGFSIGSNDLTQLTLGLDRDSAIISDLFDENNEAVKDMIARVIHDAHAAGAKIGLCGQAPSDDPAFAAFLVQQGINSISFNPDALLKGIENMLKAESAG
ncbi:MAG: phosphoenolpyruvate synthase [Saprospiraceae bacterium]|nr:phosphoenolpyruvate synthase [Saprospiraceae bacterium]